MYPRQCLYHNVERPILVDVLRHIQDGGYDVTIGPVHVGGEQRVVAVASYPIDGGGR